MNLNEVILFDNIEERLNYIPNNEIMDKLYYEKCSLPNEKQIKNYLDNYCNATNSICKFFKSGKIESKIDDIKKRISSVENKIPLYDVYQNNVFLIDSQEVYDQVINHSCRFPDSNLINDIKGKRDELVEKIKKHNDIGDNDNVRFQKGIIREKTLYKLNVMIKFLESFDNVTLQNTYMRMFWLYSEEFGKKLTICKRPSFTYYLHHIQPYYTKQEMVNIALNLGIIKNEKISDEEIEKLCPQIRENDIDYKILLKHQLYIIKNDSVGLVQYYSMHGSYFMNEYLRGSSPYSYKNEYLEDIISTVWNLILNAPEFDKSYTVYRFVRTDTHLSHLKVGDKYVEKGFMSTTRDPFYGNVDFKFGWILIKLKIPAHMKGIALCMETVSHFQKEQEIIFPPNTILKLTTKDDKCSYFHINKDIGDKIIKRYEFEVLGTEPISFIERPVYTTSMNPVDFLKINKITSFSIHEKIQYFLRMYVNPMSQFNALIGDNTYTVKAEWFDSLSVYRPLYASSTQNGFSLYSFYNKHVLFLAEIGDNEGVPFIYVNFYVKYATVSREKVINNSDFLKFIASMAYYFEVSDVRLYADYVSCETSIKDEETETEEETAYGGTYCVEFYDYLKYNKRKYSDIGVLNIELFPKFKYTQLDELRKIKMSQLLTEHDTKVRQLYKKIYVNETKEINDNVADFYTWIIDNYCTLYTDLVEIINRFDLYRRNNPHEQDYYKFNAFAYLYNRALISTIPITLNEFSIEDMPSSSKQLSKNRYRMLEDVRKK